MKFTNHEINNAIKELKLIIDANRLMYLRALTDEDKKWSLDRIEQIELKILELTKMMLE